MAGGADPVVLGVVLAYVAASLVVGLGSGRSETLTAWVAGDRGLGLVVMYFVTGATVFSAFAFLGGPGWVYTRGVSALYILGYGALGFAPMWWLGPRYVRLGREHGFVTSAELFAARWDYPALAGAAAVVGVAALIPYLTLQLKGAGLVLEIASGGGVPPAWGALGVAVVVLVYVLRGGVRGVGWTNVLQGVLMLALAWTFGLLLPWRLHGGVVPMFERLAAERPELLVAPGLGPDGAPWAWSEYTSAVWVSILGFCAWPHLLMKAFATDARTLRRTVVLYPTFQVFLIPLFLIGFAGVLTSSAPPHPDQILPHLLVSLAMPPALVGLFCAGALAACMSTADALAHAASTLLVRDLAVTAGGWRPDDAAELRAVRVGVVAVMAAAWVGSVLYTGSLGPLLLGTYGAVVQLAPAAALSVGAARVSGRAVLAGLITGTAVVAVFTVWPETRPWSVHAGLLGAAANGLVVALGSARYAPDARDRAFLAVATGEP